MARVVEALSKVWKKGEFFKNRLRQKAPNKIVQLTFWSTLRFGVASPLYPKTPLQPKRTLSSVFKSSDIAGEIIKIRNEVNNVYSDISNAHINSAINAYQAITNSKNKEYELRSIIHDLRNSYNIYGELLNKKKDESYTFLFIRHEIYIDAIYGIDRSHVYLARASISIIISSIYYILDEHSNARDWKDRSLNICSTYKTNVEEHTTAEMLFNISNRYAEMVVSTVHDGPVSDSRYSYKHNNVGRNYLKEKISNKLSPIKSIANRINV